eukprot:gnl/MRDRNA2_/MRDRNA2_102479_c0_seq1.p1 gnl/MRDRNA2_/MRDRNA2_102479_c0~~gnl/MRDRNA2_/MRDRNA2_102479_c0_seq1.p1  ORF type:complete len:251 (-),score=31.65 gnl/MRDRNA2_/MRDRNA2_102479_c0_seq1:55-807(-)
MFLSKCVILIFASVLSQVLSRRHQNRGRNQTRNQMEASDGRALGCPNYEPLRCFDADGFHDSWESCGSTAKCGLSYEYTTLRGLVVKTSMGPPMRLIVQRADDGVAATTRQEMKEVLWNTSDHNVNVQFEANGEQLLVKLTRKLGQCKCGFDRNARTYSGCYIVTEVWRMASLVLESGQQYDFVRVHGSLSSFGSSSDHWKVLSPELDGPRDASLSDVMSDAGLQTSPQITSMKMSLKNRSPSWKYTCPS